MVTSGAQQAIDLAVRTLVEPGDAVIIEQPAYYGAINALRGARARILEAPLEPDGMNLEIVERYLANARGPAAQLVSAASGWRLEPPADDEAAALLGRELIPLYVHYIDDHIARLRAVGEHRLAGSFRRWRTRLLA